MVTRAPVESVVPFDSRPKAFARRAAVGLARRAGLRLERLEDDARFVPGFSSFTTELQHAVANTPGMISLRRAMYLYYLSYASGVPGDIIEIGSWQGRSTIALAQGCKDGANGVVHAVDTFEGNPGNEQSYVIANPDRSDLRDSFEANISKAGLSAFVETWAMDSRAAAALLQERGVVARMLNIDAEHTYEAVSEELRLYTPMLARGGLLTFDDYSQRFEGVAEAVHEWLAGAGSDYVRPIQDDNFLVIRKR